MNGILNWFKVSTKIKRWIFTILVGIILACIGLCKLLSAQTLGVMDVLLVAVTFIAGCVIITVGIVFMQKRVLEILVQDTDNRQRSGNVKSLIFNKKVYNDGPNIVVLGGGKGLNTVIKGLKNYTSNITAIVTISDYGKKASTSRKLLEMMPLEEIKQSMIALSNNEEIVEPLLNYKFKSVNLKSLSFGDIYLEAMQENRRYDPFSKKLDKNGKDDNLKSRLIEKFKEKLK